MPAIRLSMVCWCVDSDMYGCLNSSESAVGRIMVSPVKGALPVRVDSNRRLADGLRGPWFNIDIELCNGLVCSPRL